MQGRFPGYALNVPCMYTERSLNECRLECGCETRRPVDPQTRRPVDPHIQTRGTQTHLSAVLSAGVSLVDPPALHIHCHTHSPAPTQISDVAVLRGEGRAGEAGGAGRLLLPPPTTGKVPGLVMLVKGLLSRAVSSLVGAVSFWFGR